MRGFGRFFTGTSRFSRGYFSQATCASIVKKGGIIVFFLGNSVGIISVGEYVSNFMPQWKSAVEVNDPFNPNGYVLNDWGKFLIDHHSSFNQMWWQWSFDRMRADPMVVKGLSWPFAQVTDAFSNQWIWKNEGYGDLGSRVPLSDSHHPFPDIPPGHIFLNNICYNLSISRTHVLKGDVLRDFWTFCSPGGGELVYLKSSRKTKPNDYPLTDYWSDFVETNTISNDWFWSIRQLEFESGILPRIHFFYEGRGRSIKDKCAELYAFNERSQEKIKAIKEDEKYGVLRFCGLATLPEGVERTDESYVYEELVYGRQNSRAF